ncbi:hypothetical protein Taro_010139 [Colocasia esculenta]|uniref:CCHC-type domain-containing protein n=1 Tax=Colocasia esculenta TaxID=4460 RepID=A0A843U8N2_COLES|nr:hypothetical protein [Colocasia esculenta]
MVKKAQLLEDATDLTDRIKGRIVRKEQAPGSTSRSGNSKKRSFNITEGPNQERKPKIATPSNTNKTNCEHCDKSGHTADECWRKASASLHSKNRNHRISECPVLKEKEKEKKKHPNGQKNPGRLQVQPARRLRTCAKAKKTYRGLDKESLVQSGVFPMER